MKDGITSSIVFTKCVMGSASGYRTIKPYNWPIIFLYCEFFSVLCHIQGCRIGTLVGYLNMLGVVMHEKHSSSVAVY